MRQDELSAEYRFDYSKAKPNRFAARMSGSTIAVLLGPDSRCCFQVIKGRECASAFNDLNGVYWVIERE